MSGRLFLYFTEQRRSRFLQRQMGNVTRTWRPGLHKGGGEGVYCQLVLKAGQVSFDTKHITLSLRAGLSCAGGGPIKKRMVRIS